MSYTPIPHGTDNWDVPLNAALVDQDGRITTNTNSIATQTTQINSLQSSLTTTIDAVVYPVDQHGAIGDGTTNDQAAIQTLLNTAPKGATVLLGRKRYGLSTPLLIPPYVTLAGPFLDRDGVTADLYPALVPLAGFTGPSVVRLVDKATGGYATENRDATLRNFNIDGVNLTSETVTGIRAEGFVHGVQIYNVGVWGMTNHSIDLVTNGSGNPYSWYMSNVNLLGNGSVTTWDGFRLLGTDHTLTNCRTLNIRGNGFFLSGLANSRLTACQAEWSALSGFYITGSYGTGQGSGALELVGCSTDRNSQYGVLIDSTGNPSILISGLMLRRDGRNGFPGTGGGGFAGLRISSATTPVVATGVTCYPGVNDDGAGVNSPERGVSVANSTYAQISNSYFHADTTPIHDGGGNTAYLRGPSLGSATGLTSAPARSATEASVLAGPITVNQGAVILSRGSSTNGAFQAQQTGDSQLRYNVNANGDILWGSGAAGGDTMLARTAANTLSVSTANLRVNTAGRGLQVAEGSNAKSGVSTLVAGTVTVANTSTTANSRIQVTSQADGGTPGFLRVSARTAGTSFTITSSNAADTSTVAWFIVEP